MQHIIQLKGIVAEKDQGRICPIKYIHNPLPGQDLSIYRKPLNFHFKTNLAEHLAIPFTPLNGNVPYASSIPTVFESKFWPESIQTAKHLIRLLSEDGTMADIPVGGNITLKKIAEKEMSEHRAMRCTAYLYPFTISPERLSVMSVIHMMYFIFDDKFEEADEKETSAMKAEFLKHLKKPKGAVTISYKKATTIHDFLTSIVGTLLAADDNGNSGGHELYNEVCKASYAVRSTKAFRSVTEYLEFRLKSICVVYLNASIKYSLGLSIDVNQPAIARFQRFAAEAISLANDLYSYDKEVKALREGETGYMCNIIPVIQERLNANHELDAIKITFLLILQRERWMVKELERLEAEECVDDETWAYLRALWVCCAGHTFYSMTSERYAGPEGAIFQDAGQGDQSSNTAVERSLQEHWESLINLDVCASTSEILRASG